MNMNFSPFKVVSCYYHPQLEFESKDMVIYQIKCSGFPHDLKNLESCCFLRYAERDSGGNNYVHLHTGTRGVAVSTWWQGNLYHACTLGLCVYTYYVMPMYTALHLGSLYDLN